MEQKIENKKGTNGVHLPKSGSIIEPVIKEGVV